MKQKRKRSIVICGGAFGDEGKGRVVDSFVNEFAALGQIVVYRDNGGANAGHTVEFDGVRVALHQLPSGVFFEAGTVILGKGMVLHPADLLEEIAEVEKAVGGQVPARIKIDEMVTLSLDTHRAFEAVLKGWQTGQHGSTGRGIAPAYVDILLRHPLRMRDLLHFDKEKIGKHYDLYQALVSGLGAKLAAASVPTLSGEITKTGTKKQFIAKLQEQAAALKPYIEDVSAFLITTWKDEKNYSFVFEKAQAIGLDHRWGVYPDVTASDTTSAGIFASTEGIIDPEQIEIHAGVLKATYMSSVGVRQLPTVMPAAEAEIIRQDAHEYGATTGRPRDVVYFDLPMQQYLARVGRLTHLVLTHMDIVYPDRKVKICRQYTLKGKPVAYRPDQEFLLRVQPVYEEFAPWDVEELRQAKDRESLPKNAKIFIEFLETEFQLPVLMITTGPERGAEVIF